MAIYPFKDEGEVKTTKIAAIIGAISAYIQEEEKAKAAALGATHRPEVNPWQLFGRQELMRTRTQWQVRKARR